MASKKLPVFALLLAGCSTTDPRRSLGELGWHPETDQPIRQLQEVLEATEQQQPRNYTSSNLGFVYDAKLYILFRQYLDAIDVGARGAALEEQGSWLHRRREAVSIAYSEYQGGTLASYVGNKAFIDLTKLRIAEIEARMPRGELP